MGLLTPNYVVGILHGKVGDLVFVRKADGQVFVRHVPIRRAEFTAGERGNQSLFTLAAAYVKRTRQQATQYAVYQAAAKLRGQRACDLANADFRHPPAIHDVDLSAYQGGIGQAIRIEAVDDFEVTDVLLTIAAADGAVLEHGPSVLDPITLRWVYLTKTAVPGAQTVVIQVTATDRPASAVSRTFDHALPAAVKLSGAAMGNGAVIQGF